MGHRANLVIADQAGYEQSFLEFIMTRQRGDKLLINPDALQNNPQGIAQAVQKQIFDDAVSSWKKKH